MLRGPRRTAALAASLVVLSGALAACGSDTPGTGLAFGDRLDAVTIDGDIGAAKIEFKERMSATSLESETMIDGTGPALVKDDEVFVNYAIGNGYTRKIDVDSFGEDAAAVPVTVGAEPNAQPQTFDDVVANVLLDHVKAGVTKGSRIVLTGDSNAFFGDLTQSAALATEGIGNDDGLVLVADVMDVTALDGPDKETDDIKLPAWAPRVTYGATGPTNFTFKKLTKPAATEPLQVAALRKGSGKVVAKGDLLVARYMGSVFGGAKPFDETFTAGKPTIKLGVGGFVEGFNEAVTGQTVGSRIIMRIPPAKGYGAEGQGDTIPADSTLYFIVDILAAV